MADRQTKNLFAPIFRGLLPAVLACLVLAALAEPHVSPAMAAPKAVYIQQLEGNYAASGVNPDGSRYSGQAKITVKNGKAIVQWNVAGRKYQGEGSLEGNRLVVEWGDTSPVIYTVLPDGTLAGSWSNGKATDTLRPLN